MVDRKNRLPVLCLCQVLQSLSFQFILNLCTHSTDIHQRSQTSCTTLCNDVVSHGAQFGGLQVFAYHTCKDKHKINAFTICALVYLHSQIAVHAGSICTCRTTVSLITGKSLKTPKFSPMPGSRWRRFWVLIDGAVAHIP